MENFIKIINPTRSKDPTHEFFFENYIKIEYKDGELSITGVMGPMSNGDCKGSAGQCIDTICELTDGWYITEINEDFDEKTIKDIEKYWEKYHLNGMRPYNEEMKKLGWDKLAEKVINCYDVRLKREMRDKQKELEEKSKKELLENRKVEISEEEQKLWKLPFYRTIYAYNEDELWEKVDNDLYEIRGIEKKNLGWVCSEEYSKTRKYTSMQNGHKDGILMKLEPKTGERYGSKWWKEEIPEGVLLFFKSLPDAKKSPAWV